MTDTTKRYRLKKDYVTPRFTYAKGADVAYLGGMYVIGIETFTEEALKSTPDWFEEVLVSEPVPYKIEVMNFVGRKKYTDERCTDTIYEFNSTRQIPLDRFPAIKQAIESCLNEPLPQPPSALNDTVVEDRFDGKRASFYAMDEVGQWAAADKELTKEKIDELMKEFHNQPLQFYSPPKRYSQSEVDAIRADTWYAARKITDKVVGEIDFKDGDRCPFYEKYFNSINDYLSSLNLNSNDTGKEDNETKSANWRSENLSKQSAPEPSALPNKEWEIVSFVSIHGEVLTLDEKKWKYRSETSSISDMDFLLKHYSIHSVRRLLPDMEVFSCKDNTNKGVIESFVIITEENRQTAVTAHLDKRENIGKIAVKVSGSLGAAHPNQLLEDLEKLPSTPTQPVVEDKPTDSMKLMKQIQKWKDTYDKPLSEWTAEDRMEWESSDMNIQQFIASKIPN